MKHLKCAVLVTALLFPLSACVGGSADLIAKVQETTKKVCGFAPAAASVAAILDAMGATGGSATVVATAANGICKALETAASRLYGPASPEFMGVPIEGERVGGV